MRTSRLACAIVALLATGLSTAFAATGVRVSFPSLDIDPLHGTELMLSGLFFTPDPSAGGFPAVVVLHGCDGMYSTLPARRGLLTARHQAMADLLVAEGYAVLFPDSFNPRGRREVCTQPAARQAILQANRRLDVLGALDYLRTRNDIAPRRIALLGWSHGGSAVLATINERSPVVSTYAHDPAQGGFFVTAIAFYPGCYASLRGRDGFVPAAPVSIFIGEADDWTAAAPCVELGKRARQQGLPLTVTTYPDTYHGFDTPNLQRPRHLDVPNGVNPGKGVTIASNPAARADAYARVKAQLRAALVP
ncbi:MAG: dienelactone hydrolase family protein [Betaproteobacteria bacterium]